MPFFSALGLVFKDKKYFTTILVSTILIFSMLVYIPVSMIPGTSLSSHLSSIGQQDLSLYLILSILTGLSITFNLFLISKKAGGIKYGFFAAAQTGTGLISAIFASIFGVATCAACLTSIFSLIGVTGVFFLVDYRVPITLVAAGILLVSLYFTSQKVMGICKNCKW